MGLGHEVIESEMLGRISECNQKRGKEEMELKIWTQEDWRLIGSRIQADKRTGKHKSKVPPSQGQAREDVRFPSEGLVLTDMGVGGGCLAVFALVDRDPNPGFWVGLLFEAFDHHLRRGAET